MLLSIFAVWTTVSPHDAFSASLANRPNNSPLAHSASRKYHLEHQHFMCKGGVIPAPMHKNKLALPPRTHSKNNKKPPPPPQKKKRNVVGMGVFSRKNPQEPIKVAQQGFFWSWHHYIKDTIPTGKDTCAFLCFRTWITNSIHIHMREQLWAPSSKLVSTKTLLLKHYFQEWPEYGWRTWMDQNGPLQAKMDQNGPCWSRTC